MSIKLFNGYKMPRMSLSALQAKLWRFQKVIEKIAHVEVSRLLARRCADLLDLYRLGATIELDPEVWKGANKISAFGYAHLELMEKQRKIESTGLRDPVFDFECTITVFPSRNKTLAILYTERKEYEEAWEKFPGVDPYPYWNNTDRPDGVSEARWLQIEREWGKAMNSWQPPARSGFTFTAMNRYSTPHPKPGDITKRMPPFKDRVRNRVMARIWMEVGRRMKAREKKTGKSWRMSDLMAAVRKYTNSAAGKNRMRILTDQYGNKLHKRLSVKMIMESIL